MAVDDPSTAPATNGAAEPVAPPVAAPVSFINTLPENLRSNPSLKDVKDAATLAQRFIDTKSMVGNSIAMPPKDAPPEIQKEWYESNRAKLAERNLIKVAPESPDKYDYKWEGVEITPELDGSLRQLAHSRGWDNEDMVALSDWYSKNVAGSVSEIAKADSEKALTSLFGGTSEGYKEGVAFASDGAEQLQEMFPDAWDRLEKERVISGDGKSWTWRSSDPMTIFLLAHYARTTAGETVDAGLRKPGVGAGVEALSQEIEDIRSNKENVYYKMIQKGDPAGQARLDELLQRKYGTKEV